jgi:hypothetical protein
MAQGGPIAICVGPAHVSCFEKKPMSRQKDGPALASLDCFILFFQKIQENIKNTEKQLKNKKRGKFCRAFSGHAGLARVFSCRARTSPRAWKQKKS